jgi:oligopeptide/dipeptide ABC transporter ATP-binding protein
MPLGDVLLRVEGLTAGFHAGGRFVPVVRGVDFTIARGETLGLVGESGSGKTVTALSIVRLLRPPGRIHAGRIVFEDRDLLALDEGAMRSVRGGRIGFVFQEPAAALSPVFTIGDQIAEAIVAQGGTGWREARRLAIDFLEAVRVADAAQRAREYPHQLSGGLRQRAMIAIALACRPPLLIADEPTAALDATIQAEILELLRDLGQRFGLALLLVAHDLGVIAQAADRVAVMYAGEIVEQGETAAVLGAPAHPYTQGLLASLPGRLNGPDGRLRPIAGSMPTPGHQPTGCAFEPRCPARFDRCRSEHPAAWATAAPDRAPRVSRCHLAQPGRS